MNDSVLSEPGHRYVQGEVEQLFDKMDTEDNLAHRNRRADTAHHELAEESVLQEPSDTLGHHHTEKALMPHSSTAARLDEPSDGRCLVEE